MSAPIVVSVSPADQDTDVVLGQLIQVTFDQVIDTTTLNDSTFALTFPAPAQILTAGQLIAGEASPSTVIVPGTWAFVTNGSNQTVASFTPAKAFDPNTHYTATLLGADAALSTQNVMNLAAQSMAVSYQWSFVSGVLNLITPPPVSPLVSTAAAIDPAQIKIIPRRRNRLGMDLSQEIDIIFPGPVDATSFTAEDLLMSVTPLLGDPTVTPPPADLAYNMTVTGNRVSLTITGW